MHDVLAPLAGIASLFPVVRKCVRHLTKPVCHNPRPGQMWDGVRGPIREQIA